MEKPTSWTGSTLGIVVFLAGLFMIGFAFALALEMFSKSPEVLLVDPASDEAGFNVGGAANIFGGLIIRCVAIILMGILGSIVSNRGIKLFAESRGIRDKKATEAE
ncbi:MAG: hypothetical protein ACK4P3_07320 [Fimbriimonadaceae bacterium]